MFSVGNFDFNPQEYGEMERMTKSIAVPISALVEIDKIVNSKDQTDEVEELQEQIDRLEMEIDELESENEGLQDDLDTANERISELEDELKEKE